MTGPEQHRVVILNDNIDHIMKDIGLRKATSLGTKKVVKIFRRSFGDALYIQTPQVTVPYSGMFSQDMVEVQFDVCHDDFLKRLKSLETGVLDRLRLHLPEVFQGRTQCSKIRDKEYGPVLRLKIHSLAQTPLFNNEGIQLPTDYYKNALSREQVLYLILWVKWVWWTQTSYGIEYIVMQAKCAGAPPTSFMFCNPTITSNGTTNNTNNTNNTNKKYEKYEKMRSLGIPTGAVKSKMVLDGLGEDAIQEFTQSTGAQMHPPPPPLSLTSESLPSKPKLTFLSQIKKGEFMLKKAPAIDEEAVAKKKMIHKISKFVDTTKTVPSLEDILAARQNLKKVQS
jgi:hypothetical protein